jgi:hypothetical protein
MMGTTNLRGYLTILVALATLSSARSLNAQVAWEAPMMASPRAPAGLGIYLGDLAGADIGVVGTWRGNSPIEFRFGIADRDPGDNISGLFGLTYNDILARESGDLPFDVGWFAGGGVGFGDWALLTFPVGLSAAHTFSGDGITFTPYVAPRLFLDAALGDDDNDLGGDDDEVDLGFAVDLGLDLGIRRGWTLRFGASLGDHEAFLIGIVF